MYDYSELRERSLTSPDSPMTEQNERYPLQVNSNALKRFSVTIILFALVLAAFNLYMNMMMTSNLPPLKLDMTADGDLFGFHQDGHSHDERHGRPPQSSIDSRARRILAKGTRPKTISCPGLCPGHLTNDLDQAGYVADAVQRRIQATEMREPQIDALHAASKHTPNMGILEIRKVWDTVNSWPDGRSLWPRAFHNWSMVISAVRDARIVRASVPRKGVQVKALIEFDGGVKGYLKPKRMDSAVSLHGRPYDGPDRHNAEIAAFHLARLFGLQRVPIVIGRVVDARTELFKVADATLIDSFFTEAGSERLCFYRRGKCSYCTKAYAACAQEGSSQMEAAISLHIPETQFTLREFRHPWGRTYRDDTRAAWETDASYCQNVTSHPFYGQSPIFLDLIDMAVFDFLIGNADRHRFEVATRTNGQLDTQQQDSMVLMLDNGKGFRSPDYDEMSILAPLYQCCKLRKKMYDVLHYFAGAEMNLGASLDGFMVHDPTYPVLPLSYLKAVNRRLIKVLNLVELCVERHGRHVIVNDAL